ATSANIAEIVSNTRGAKQDSHESESSSPSAGKDLGVDLRVDVAAADDAANRAAAESLGIGHEGGEAQGAGGFSFQVDHPKQRSHCLRDCIFGNFEDVTNPFAQHAPVMLTQAGRPCAVSYCHGFDFISYNSSLAQ